ncbi:hypothetical protein [Aquimarina algicola]|nr:hypothetical protein [Aquimarina algicola]
MKPEKLYQYMLEYQKEHNFNEIEHSNFISAMERVKQNITNIKEP